MRKVKKIRRTKSRMCVRRRPSHQPLDVSSAEPEMLRESVIEALSQLSEEQQRNANGRLLTSLKKAGVNIGQNLLLLGVPARTSEELTPPEIATLIRYVRISEPQAMTALAPVLLDFLTTHSRQTKPARRAA